MRALAAIAATAVTAATAALATPAALAREGTEVEVLHFDVELNHSLRQAVEPGTTFLHCRRDLITRLGVVAQMEHPSRRGVEFDLIFNHRGEDGEGGYGLTTKRHGTIRESIGTEGDQGLGNGRWITRFESSTGSRVLGRASIRFRPTSGPGCER